MDEISLIPLGPSAFRIKFAEVVEAAALSRCRGIMEALGRIEWEGLIDVTPAYGEVLMEFAPERGGDRNALGRQIRDVLQRARPLPPDSAPLHEIPVIYDGPDLSGLAALKGLSPEQVIEMHAASTYTVYVIGFSPGFPYLGPLDERLHAPRLASPRPRIEPGSVAIGGGHTGIYSIASAGGWRIIGRTPVEIFSRAKASGSGSASAFLLSQGDRVRFVPQ